MKESRMKRTISITAVLILLVGSQSFSQTGTLELFADRAGTACVLADTPYFQSIYVFQTGGASSTGVRFSAPRPACWNATWIGDNWGSGAKVGSSQSDVTVGFGVCRPLPVLVLEIQYLAGGTATPCCKYEIKPIARFAYTNCNFFELPMVVGPRAVTINPDESCPCMVPVSTEESTWGRVKALYR
jgi:hypothetical protein